MISILALLAGLFLAYGNGANDNFKGVATLYGSGVCSYRTALIWSTLTTALGSLSALVLSHGLIAAFSGKGLVPNHLVGRDIFVLSVAVASATTVILATRLGLPISTTHALTGGLLGAGLMATSGEINFQILGLSFFLPLLLGPLLSMILSSSAYLILRYLPERLSYKHLHFLSGGIVCFSRALNDTPKIAAILLIGEFISPNFAMISIGVLMALGGALNSKRIAETMSHKISNIKPAQGLCANLVTGSLVILASLLSLPVSTTHVSVGTIVGIGTITKTAHWKNILPIFLAWITTLPISAIISAFIFNILNMSSNK